MFRYGDHFMGIQGHPEYTKDILFNLIDRLLHRDLIEVKFKSSKKKKPEFQPSDSWHYTWMTLCIYRSHLLKKPSLSWRLMSQTKRHGRNCALASSRGDCEGILELDSFAKTFLIGKPRCTRFLKQFQFGYKTIVIVRIPKCLKGQWMKQKQGC